MESVPGQKSALGASLRCNPYCNFCPPTDLGFAGYTAGIPHQHEGRLDKLWGLSLRNSVKLSYFLSSKVSLLRVRAQAELETFPLGGACGRLRGPSRSPGDLTFRWLLSEFGGKTPSPSHEFTRTPGPSARGRERAHLVAQKPHLEL